MSAAPFSDIRTKCTKPVFNISKLRAASEMNFVQKRKLVYLFAIKRFS